MPTLAKVDIINILSNFSGHLSVFDIFSFCMRLLGWLIIKGLVYIINLIEHSVDEIYSLNGFLDSKVIKDIVEKIQPCIFPLLLISILFIGYQIMFNRKFESEKLIQNVIIAMMVIVVLPSAMVKLTELTTSFREDFKGSEVTSAEQIVKNHLNDVYLYDKDGFKSTTLKVKNNIPPEKVMNININETVNLDKVDNKEVFKQKLTLDSSGKEDLVDLEKIFFIEEKYYRWDFEYITGITSLLAIALALICTTIKIITLIYGLAVQKILAPLLAVSDISNGQKTRELIKHILATFAILGIMTVLLKVYILLNGYIASAEGLSMGSQVIAIIGATVALIGAPDIIEQILGIDAGVKNGYNFIKGADEARKTAVAGANLLAKGASKAVSGLSMAGAGMKGAMDGYKDASSLADDMESVQSENNKANETPKSLKEEMGEKEQNKNPNDNNIKNQNSLEDDIANNSDNDTKQESLEDDISNVNPDNNNKIENPVDLNNDIEEKSLDQDMSDNNIKDNSPQDSINDTQKQDKDLLSNDNNNGNKPLDAEMKSNGGEGLNNNSHDINNDRGLDNAPRNNLEKDMKDKSGENINNNNGNNNIGKTRERDNRTVGEYFKGRINNSPLVNNAKRSYDLGYNSAYKSKSKKINENNSNKDNSNRKDG